MDKRLIGAYRAVGGAIQSAGAYSMERILRLDPLTGARIMQLTSYPVLSHALYFHCPSVTPDSKTLVFMTYPRAGRFTSPDAWRVNLDGSDLRAITDQEGLVGFVLAPDGKTVYAQDGAQLLAWSIEGGEPREIGRVSGVAYAATICGGTSADGAYYFSTAVMESGLTAIVRYATDGSEARVLLTRGALPHMQVDTSGTDRILFGCEPDAQGYGMFFTDRDGKNLRPFRLRHCTGHYAFFGKMGRVIATVNRPFGSIALMGEDDGEPEIIIKGGHFWHAAGSDDGEWIVSDTNWPDLGLILVNAKTGIWAPLCHPFASSGHPQWTHPHPFFSPDGRRVLFNSDRTGIGQVYAVEVPEDIRRQLAGT